MERKNDKKRAKQQKRKQTVVATMSWGTMMLSVFGLFGIWDVIQTNTPAKASTIVNSSKHVSKPSKPSLQSTQSVTKPQLSVTYGTVTTNGLHVRSGASTNDSIIAVLNQGFVVTITQTLNNWYAISLNGQTGYVSSQYVSLTPDATPSEYVPLVQQVAPTPKPVYQAPQPAPISKSVQQVASAPKPVYQASQPAPISKPVQQVQKPAPAPAATPKPVQQAPAPVFTLHQSSPPPVTRTGGS